MAAKKKAARKAREWTMSVTTSGRLWPPGSLWHYRHGVKEIRVREVLPRKRPARRKGER